MKKKDSTKETTNKNPRNKQQNQSFQIYDTTGYFVKMFLWMFASIKETNKKWKGEN